ncbi:MAG: NAD(P)-binding domain-containing protein [Bilophila wadsworthia]
MCRNLLNKGYALQVWNRSPEKAAKVAGWGAEALPRLRRLPAAPAW